MRRTAVIAIGALVLGGGVAWGAARHLGAELTPRPLSAAVPGIPATEQREREIALFEERVRTDPYSPEDRGWLASLLLLRGRAVGNDGDVHRAETLARESLELRAAHNASAALTLSASLLEQHRFAEALEVAERLVAQEPENVGYRAHLAEVQVEIGDYRGAAATFGSLQSARGNMGVAARLARWAEIEGRTTDARNLLYAARDQASRHYRLSADQVAWFHLRLGDHEMQNGRLKEAAASFRDGLAARPDDHRVMFALARLHAARGEWKETLRWAMQGEERLDLVTMALIGDAHAALGDRAEAERWYARLEADAAENPEPFNRQLYTFRLNQGRHVAETLATLQEEIRTRKDVLGYDLLAWALHASGRHAEAREAMQQALRMGTRDATFFYHAGMIERALGNHAAARAHLEEALKVNPYFPQAAEARAALRG